MKQHPTKIRALLTALENGTVDELLPWNLPPSLAPILLDYLNGLNESYGLDLYKYACASLARQDGRNDLALMRVGTIFGRARAQHA